MQTAAFAVIHGIEHEPAFNWWAQHVLKKNDRVIVIIRKWQNSYLKRSQKFGIELSKTVKQAYALDNKIGNTLQTDKYSKKSTISEWHLKS